MKSVIDGLKPEIVWKHFENITKIPRPSKHEEKILNSLRKFANERKLRIDALKKSIPENIFDKMGIE